MATLTLGNVGQAEAVEVGINARICRISLSVSLSVGDIHIIGRIPHGAIPLEAIFYTGSAFALASTGAVIAFGTSASQDLFFASATFSATNSAAGTFRSTRTLGSAKQISLSDDAMPRYENLTMIATAGVSTGYIGDLVVYYKMPGSSL